jgi:FMN reductase
MSAPLIVGLGGTMRRRSTTEEVLAYCLAEAGRLGARTQAFTARELRLPMYSPQRRPRGARVVALLDALRAADGVVIVSPGYHGGVSGMIKNALDYVEDLRDDERPYLEGRPVGCVTCAAGWQATTTTLVALRSIVHALRAWPTPLGVALNSGLPTAAAGVSDPAVHKQLDTLARQVVDFATLRDAVGETGRRG